MKYDTGCSRSMEDVIEALRLHFLQGNSQITNVGDWIDERVIETIDKIRRLPKKVKTSDIVSHYPTPYTSARKR